MKSRLFSLSVCTLLCVPLAAADKHQLPPPHPAAEYPAHETHSDEHVTVGAEPLDSKEKEAVFRVDYLKRQLMPIRMIVTNDSDKPIHLDQARIYLITRDGEKLHADTEEQADRRMSDIKDPSRSANLPFPIPHGSGLKTKDKDIHADYDEADFPSLIVAPHGTQSGVLFFDVSDYEHPLQGAKLYVKQMTDDEGGELFYFEVPLMPTPGAEKKPADDPAKDPVPGSRN